MPASLHIWSLPIPLPHFDQGKPIDTVETMIRIRALLEIRYKFVELEQELQHLRVHWRSRATERP